MAGFVDAVVGRQLYVGKPSVPNSPVGFGNGPAAIQGAAYFLGPAYVGDVALSKFTGIEGSLMVGPCINPTAKPTPISVLYVRGLGKPTDVVLGDPTGPVGFSFFGTLGTITMQVVDTTALQNNTGAQSNTGAKSDTGAVAEAGAQATAGATKNDGARNINGNFIVNGIVKCGHIASPTVDYLQAQINSKKGFDIPHPSKPNYRLRYICLESSQAEVYLRGKLVDENVIELPDYWKDFIDIETIGVNLTSIGYYQELFVEKIEWGKNIIVKNNAGGGINCSYVVFGERKDGEKNIPEYEGQTPADYPGDNSEYSLAGWDYDVRNK
jgi:hypothetical protein